MVVGKDPGLNIDSLWSLLSWHGNPEHQHDGLEGIQTYSRTVYWDYVHHVSSKVVQCGHKESNNNHNKILLKINICFEV